MVALIIGLNTYFGREGVKFLQDEDFNIIGLTRDAALLEKKLGIIEGAKLYSIDICQVGNKREELQLPHIDISFYFSQIPDLNDEIGINYELLSLHNFIQLSKRNNVRRIVYFGKRYEQKYLAKILDLFKASDVDFTLVLKDIALGEGTSFDGFINDLLKNRKIYLYKPKKKIYVRPVVLKDVYRWIRSVDWQKQYINQVIEFGGENVYEIEDIIKRYIQRKGIYSDYKIVPLRNATMAKYINMAFHNLDIELYSEYIRQGSSTPMHDNSSWKQTTQFAFTPLEEVL